MKRDDFSCFRGTTSLRVAGYNHRDNLKNTAGMRSLVKGEKEEKKNLKTELNTQEETDPDKMDFSGIGIM